MKPQGYAKSPGCHPVPGEGEGRAGPGEGQVRVSPPRGEGPWVPGPCTFLPGAGWDAGRKLGGLETEAEWGGGGRGCPAAASHTGALGRVQHRPARSMKAGGQQAPRGTAAPPGDREAHLADGFSPSASPEWAADLELGRGVGRAQGGVPGEASLQDQPTAQPALPHR